MCGWYDCMTLEENPKESLLSVLQYEINSSTGHRVLILTYYIPVKDDIYGVVTLGQALFNSLLLINYTTIAIKFYTYWVFIMG